MRGAPGKPPEQTRVADLRPHGLRRAPSGLELFQHRDRIAMNAPAAIVPPYRHTPLFPLGQDSAPYRKLGADGVRVEKRGGAARCSWSSARRCARSPRRPSATSITCCGPGTSRSCARSSTTRRRARQRQVRRLRLPQERQYRGRRRAAHVPGHRHRHHHGQEGPARLHRRRRRGGAGRGRARRLSQAQSALFAARAASPCSRRRTPARTCRRRSRSTPRARARTTDAYKFLFIAKGGGSANKSFLFQATPSILTHDR